jgi:GMP synthase PP-ATPase subunit
MRWRVGCTFEGVGLRVRVMGEVEEESKRLAMCDIVVVERYSGTELGSF